MRDLWGAGEVRGSHSFIHLFIQPLFSELQARHWKPEGNLGVPCSLGGPTLGSPNVLQSSPVSELPGSSRDHGKGGHHPQREQRVDEASPRSLQAGAQHDEEGLPQRAGGEKAVGWQE